MSDPHHLQRFLDAQEASYPAVLDELRLGRKRSHWMWFIFPQVSGLGHSATARHFAIGSLAEAQAYLSHPLLGERLRECAGLLLTHEGTPAEAILGSVDALKLCSSMSLFATLSADGLFEQVLEAFFGGAPDPLTGDILTRWRGSDPDDS